MLPGYVELSPRSNFSLLDGASHPAELVLRAQELGHAAIGLCDTNSLGGIVRAHVAARELELPFVPGVRLRLADGGEYLAWPTSRASYGRLTRLLSEARMRAPKGEEAVERDALLRSAEGLCLAAVSPVRPDLRFAEQLGRDAAALRGRLPLPLFCTATIRFDDIDEDRLEALDELTRVLGIELLATNEVRYHVAERRPLADLLTAIRLRTTVDNLGEAAEPNAERHLKSPAEMVRLFRRAPQAVRNTLRVLEATRGFSLDQLRYEYPEEILDPGRTAQQTLAARVAAAAAERWTVVPEAIEARLREELSLIGRLDYARYFLTVHEIVRFARAQGILCQGRGSAANSAVCFVLGITAVDPGKHDLLFERFLSENRGEPPDIDIDFEHERREEVIQHLYQRYGRERAAICATVIRYRDRSAIREVGRAMGLSEDVTARLARASWGPGREMTLHALAAELGLDTRDRRLRQALTLATEIRGFPRHLATHVGGFVITRGPLTELVVVGRAAMDGRTVLEWDKDDITALGILKVDVLGLGMLSCLRRAFTLMERHTGRRPQLHAIEGDCAETFAMLRRGDSLGVFQVESRAQMNMLPRLRPRAFYDLVIQVAIVRPGPIQGDMVHPYLRRRQHLEEVIYPRPGEGFGPPDEMERVLGRTLGVPLFQEQAMRLAIVAAGFSPAEADDLRRAMATFKYTKGVGQYRDRLVEGMVARGYERALAERVFRQIEGFGSYGFPESHAASFAQLVYTSAWIKCHHPGVFAAALLNSQPMGFYAPAQIVRDARAHGVAVRPLDLNSSEWDSTLESDHGSTGGLALRLGLRLARGLTERDGQALVAARAAGNGSPFGSVREVAGRSGIGRRGIEALAAADAFAASGLGRREALWDAAALGSGVEDLPLFAVGRAEAAVAAPRLQREAAPLLPPERAGEQVVEDYRSTTLSLRPHPLALLRPGLQRLGWDDTRRLDTAPSGTRVRVPGLVLMRQRPGSAKGIVFVTTEDEHGVANLVIYPDIVARDHAVLVGARLILAEGRVEREEADTEVPVIHLVVRRLLDRTDLLDALG
ncbi:error-prone DNA polymerase [Roseomonas elaeocarpi]|uniref:Error-prone DNA polymerase n=1 Tax=Roseomonas elaeocarpi TaxID=907779 RepID=A0ABV6JR14_9PROT